VTRLGYGNGIDYIPKKKKRAFHLRCSSNLQCGEFIEDQIRNIKICLDRLGIDYKAVSGRNRFRRPKSWNAA